MIVAVSRNSPPVITAIGNVINAIVTPISGLFQRVFSAEQLQAKDAVWERVVVKKIHTDGSFYKYIDEKGKVSSDDALFEYVVHNPSGTLYLDEAKGVVAFKCVIVALANPIFAAVKMLWHASRLVIDTAIFATNAIKEYVRLRSLPHAEEALIELKKSTFEAITSSVKENLCRIVSAPIYAVGVELGALMGLVFPYEARAFIAEVERLSQDSRGIKDYYCSLDDCLSGNISNLSEYVEKLSKKEVCFLAFCFQSRGLLDPLKFHIEKRLPVKTF